MAQPRLRDKILEFERQRVTVIGDTIYDRYRYTHAAGLAKGFDTVHLVEDRESPAAGGAANVAANVAQLGCSGVDLISLIGADIEAHEVNLLLGQHRAIDKSNLVWLPGRRTTVKERLLNRNEQLVYQVDRVPTGPVSPNIAQLLNEALTNAFAESDVIIVVDHDYGVLGEAVFPHLSRLCSQHPNRVVVVDAKTPRKYARVRCSAMKPSRAELANLIRLDIDTRGGPLPADLVKNAQSIIEAVDTDLVSVSMGADGCVMIPRDYKRAAHLPAASHKVVSPIGAGDTFTAALALALSTHLPFARATRLANDAAGIVVEKQGTAWVTARELTERVDP